MALSTRWVQDTLTSVILTLSLDYTVYHLFVYSLLCVLTTDPPAFCLSNLCSRGKARVQQDHTFTLYLRYHQRLGYWLRDWHPILGLLPLCF